MQFKTRFTRFAGKGMFSFIRPNARNLLYGWKQYQRCRNSLVEVQVDRINYPPTPLRFRLLCRMTYSTLDGLQPFSQEEYQPITQLGKVA